MAMSPPKTDHEHPLSHPLSQQNIVNSPLSPGIMPDMYVVPGVVVAERFFNVPLDYFDDSRGTIQIFARHCVSLARQKQMDQLQLMVYLQGGTTPQILRRWF